jgi:hypothetical protein
MQSQELATSHNSFLATRPSSQNTLLTSGSLRRLSIPPESPKSECQECSTQDRDYDDVNVVVVTVACEVETERYVDNAQDQ